MYIHKYNGMAKNLLPCAESATLYFVDLAKNHTIYYGTYNYVFHTLTAAQAQLILNTSQ